MSEVMVRPVRTNEDYEAAIEDIATLMSARAGTPEGDLLDVLTTLVEAYEADHHPIDPPDPIALVEFAMEQRGEDRTALEPLVGSRGRVSEILNRKRALSVDRAAPCIDRAVKLIELRRRHQAGDREFDPRTLD